ncbi:glutathione peroxidase [Puia dinghuensis]|uniref:Glutathione peroxidase n=1 Tax=Puia dinghuensis TaxID=1792502 RepID=A0A8J2U9N2_9BACT|nr:glutathione peroxidase [Puia dinghuensis]GGA87925.1 glutathione peroxidase [Puia dinghuensis]
MLKLLFYFLLAGPGPIYSLSFTDAQGHLVQLSAFKGKKILLVNTASGSSRASQYASLEKLYELYKDSLVIIAFPSNDFGHEPATGAVISQNVVSQYNIQFIMAANISVTGATTHPVFQWLTSAALNGLDSNPVGNDFYKFLVDSAGNWKGVFSDEVDPMSAEMQNAIKQ